jgi:hypothetical protein
MGKRKKKMMKCCVLHWMIISKSKLSYFKLFIYLFIIGLNVDGVGFNKNNISNSIDS